MVKAFIHKWRGEIVGEWGRKGTSMQSNEIVYKGNLYVMASLAFLFGRNKDNFHTFLPEVLLITDGE